MRIKLPFPIPIALSVLLPENYDKDDGHIYMYTVDEEDRKLKCLSRTLTDVPLREARYCAFHPAKPYLFGNHKHTGHGRMIATAFRYDKEGRLTYQRQISCCGWFDRRSCKAGSGSIQYHPILCNGEGLRHFDPEKQFCLNRPGLVMRSILSDNTSNSSIQSLGEDENCKFVLYIGSRRQMFEKYLEQACFL